MKYFRLVLMICSIALIGCAKRGTISGGLKDTIAPVLKSSYPKNYSVNFAAKTIKLSFDEYIKLKNLNKQLIISPPMDKAPEILPTTASKYITINIKDTLKPNTTYSFNFGQSIEDNNESIPYKQFKYVFSTGPYIDSLALNGRIKDAHDKKSDAFVTVMLYDIDEKFNDSIIYKKSPRYVTNTLDSATTFKFENLKAGKYLLVALKDANSNYKFNPETDKIGFRKQYVTIPNDTVFELELFKEQQLFKAIKASQASGNRLLMGYAGNPKDIAVKLQHGSENLETIVTKFEGKDSLQIWYKPIKLTEGVKSDSLRLSITQNAYTKDFGIKIKNEKADSLSLKPIYTGELPLREKFTISTSVPINKVDPSKMQLTNKDSIVVDFKTDYDIMKQQLLIDFKKEPLEKYKFKLFLGALTDYIERTNDTIMYQFSTKNTSDYGNLTVKLENVRQFPVIVELTDKKGDVMYSAYSERETQIDFSLIKPSLFTLRVIYDENKNKEWDTGSFLEKRQTEQVIYFPKEIDVRANWDVEQTFNLALP